MNISATIAFPRPDLRLSRLPANGRQLAHDWSVDDGAHDKSAYEPRGFDLPETEKFRRNEYVQMTYPRAKLWFDLFKLCAPANLEKLPDELRRKQDGTYWLNDYWHNLLPPLEQWWLFLIYWARAFTNKKSIDMPGYYDPITGFGYPDEFGNLQPFWKEGVTTCGNALWVAEGVGGAGVPVWCIDALADPLPSAEHVIQYAALVHAATVSTTNHHDPTPVANAPKGRWDVDPFGYFNGNMVPVPMYSIWAGDNFATTIYDGILLRLNWFETIRILPLDPDWCPYYPARPLFPR